MVLDMVVQGLRFIVGCSAAVECFICASCFIQFITRVNYMAVFAVNIRLTELFARLFAVLLF